MKKQNFRDRMHEHEGMMHKSGRHHAHHHGVYEHEMDRPSIPRKGKNEPMTNAHDFKSDAMDTAYGQAGMAGCKADEKKIHSQFKNYGWDANTGY